MHSSLWDRDIHIIGCALNSVYTVILYTKRTSIHCSTIDHAWSIVAIIMIIIKNRKMDVLRSVYYTCGYDLFYG